MEAKIANTRVSSTMYILRRNSNRKLSRLSSVQKKYFIRNNNKKVLNNFYEIVCLLHPPTQKHNFSLYK